MDKFSNITGVNKILAAIVAFMVGVVVGFGLPGLVTIFLWAVAIGLLASGVADLIDLKFDENPDARKNRKM